MRQGLQLLAALALGVIACGDEREAQPIAQRDEIPSPAPQPDTAPPPAPDTSPADTPMGAPPDETATAGSEDQPAPQTDEEISQQIREKINTSPDFSAQAQKVTVDTRAGVVTLRGSVETELEKEKITAIARDMPGVNGVDDQLVVAKP